MGLRDGTRIGHRPHGTAQNKRHDDGGLIGACIGPRRLGHGAVPQERRVDIDVAEDDAVLVDKVTAKKDARHFDRIFRTLL